MAGTTQVKYTIGTSDYSFVWGSSNLGHSLCIPVDKKYVRTGHRAETIVNLMMKEHGFADTSSARIINEMREQLVIFGHQDIEDMVRIEFLVTEGF